MNTFIDMFKNNMLAFGFYGPLRVVLSKEDFVKMFRNNSYQIYSEKLMLNPMATYFTEPHEDVFILGNVEFTHTEAHVNYSDLQRENENLRSMISEEPF